jgi:hypothetical protein
MDTVRRVLDAAHLHPVSLLGIYLNDHRGGAAGGLALARRSLSNNQGSPLGEELAAIVRDLEQDAATLNAIAACLSVPDNPIKRAFACAGELVGRLKPNGRLNTYSPLSLLLELEMLLAGIDAKRSLWRSLDTLAVGELSDFAFEELEHRASDQRARLIPFHTEAARDALASPSAPRNPQ